MSRGWILMGAPEPFNNDGGGEKAAFVFYLKTLVSTPLDPACVHMVDVRMYLWCVFEGAGESGKSTIVKQMKILHVNGFNAEWVPILNGPLAITYMPIYAFIFIYVCIFMTLPFMSNTVDARMLYIPWMHSVQALQRLLGPLSHAKQLISFTPVSPPP